MDTLTEKRVVPMRARGKEAEQISFANGLGSGIISGQDFISVMAKFLNKDIVIVVGEGAPYVGMEVKGAGLFDVLISKPESLYGIIPDEYCEIFTLEDILQQGQSIADETGRGITVRQWMSPGNVQFVHHFHPAAMH